MEFDKKYGKKNCMLVKDIRKMGSDLDTAISVILQEFYNDVNKYLVDGKENCQANYLLNFAFTMANNKVEDNDPEAEAMFQYTARYTMPREKRYGILGGKDAKYITDELILPAYYYLTTKCHKIGYTATQSTRRTIGAPVVFMPSSKSISGFEIFDKEFMVTPDESPKLYDGLFELPSTLRQSAKTSIFD